MREGRLSDEFSERTKKFAAFIIRFYVRWPKGRDEVQVCVKQMLRSSTSNAATLEKLRGLVPKPSSSQNSVERFRKADETQLWLELLREECGIDCLLTIPIEQEAGELIAIFTTIIRRTGAK